MGEFLMPSLGADMEAGTIVEWRVSPGDVVRRGDIVAVVDTEKSDIDVEVFEGGTIAEILVPPGRQVPVGTPLARIVGSDRSAPAEAPAPAGASAPAGAPAPAEAPDGVVAPAPAERVRVSPRARRRAEAEGVDLRTVTGTGAGGAIVADDVSTAAGPRPAPPPPGHEDHGEGPGGRGAEHRLETMRQVTGTLMSRANREIPHYHLVSTIDLLAARTWLDDANATRPVRERLLPAALLLKATALAAAQEPGFNGTWDEGFRPAPDVHLGVAVSLRGGGLVAPAIRHCDTLTLDEVMAALRDLVARARSGHLRSSEVSDATLTVTNLGDQGAEEVHGVIYPPQVALVGFGRICDRPWAAGGMLGVRPTVRASLAADHRVTGGREGSRLLAAVDRLLHHPEDL